MKARFQRLLFASACALLIACASGCRQDMHDQPKMIPQRHSAFFADGRSVRQQVAGTVSRAQYQEASYLTTGLINGAEGSVLPFPATMTVLARGQERFNVYCSPCHSRVGNGKGAIVQRGYYSAGNLQSTRLRDAPIGHFFWVMSHGYGAMPNYSVEIQPEDRWAIAAYIRALQLSQNAARADLPGGAQVSHMRDLLLRTGRPQAFLESWDDSADADETPAPRVASSPNIEQSATTTASPSATGTTTKVSGQAGTKNAETAGAGKVPGGAVTQEDKTPAPPPAKAVAAGDAEHGKTLYMTNCSVCHQPTRAGLPPVFPSLLGIIDKDGEAKVRKVAREGIADAKPPMPPHPDLTDTDLNDLIAFLKTK